MSKSGTIAFRAQQNSKTTANDENVKIFAPAWVKHALEKLSPELAGIQFDIGPGSGKSWVIKNTISLTDLVAIARNESANVSGIINFSQYQGIDPKTVIALRDIVKHCVIVGKDIATHFGGYGKEALQKLTPNHEVYICDLPGLQFQEFENTGRHVLLTKENDFPIGTLDDEIFENTVGEKKSTYDQATKNNNGRFLTGKFNGKAILFDSHAFQAFVMQDFILAATSLNTLAASAAPQDELNFKFLKYGAGFFAYGLTGEAKAKLSENLAIAAFKSIQKLLNLSLESRSQIKRIELPFFDDHTENVSKVIKEIGVLCKSHNIEFASTASDALKSTSKYKTATTNCSDPHAIMGNEMHHQSVDAAIAENLQRKGNNFSPICNNKMGQEYVNVDHLTLQKSAIKQNKTSPSIAKPQQSNGLSKQGTTLSKLTGSAIAATVASFLVKTGQAARLGLASNWILTITIGVAVFVGSELIRFMKKRIQTAQHREYQRKTDCDLNKLNHTQLDAFDIGQKSTKSVKDYVFGLCSWQAYRSPKAYYAGYTAQQNQDNDLIAKIQTRLAK